jgi:hypothetical protein
MGFTQREDETLNLAANIHKASGTRNYKTNGAQFSRKMITTVIATRSIRVLRWRVRNISGINQAERWTSFCCAFSSGRRIFPGRDPIERETEGPRLRVHPTPPTFENFHHVPNKD